MHVIRSLSDYRLGFVIIRAAAIPHVPIRSLPVLAAALIIVLALEDLL